MSICKDSHNGKASTSRQIFNHVKKTETPMHDVRDLMLSALLQYQKADKIGLSLGVLDDKASFTDSVSWCSIVGKMDHHKQSLDATSKEQLSKLVGYLDELSNTFDERIIQPIQKHRDRWMKKVIMWDVLALVAFAVTITAVFLLSGNKLTSASVSELIQQRPIFFSLMTIAAVTAFISLHFSIRRSVINNMIDSIEEKLPLGMSLKKSLTRNARIRHSIFRPNPVGWGFSQRQRLQSISDTALELEGRLSEVLSNYQDDKKSE